MAFIEPWSRPCSGGLTRSLEWPRYWRGSGSWPGSCCPDASVSSSRGGHRRHHSTLLARQAAKDGQDASDARISQAVRHRWAFFRRNLFFALWDVYHRPPTATVAGRLINSSEGEEAPRSPRRAGPTFVKLGQVLSRRPDVPGYLIELESPRPSGPSTVCRDPASLAEAVCGEQMRRGTRTLCFHCNPLEDSSADVNVTAASWRRCTAPLSRR
jgi:hypothetical protein